MKKSKILIILGAFLLTAGAFFALALAWSHKKIEDPTDLINISDLSEEFMDNYLTSYAEITKNYSKDNLLIVTAKNKPVDSYGAVSIVDAPNHQYFFQYDSEKAKNIAYSKLRADSTISVAENTHYELLEDESGNSAYNSWGIERMGLDHAAEIIEGWTPADVTVAIIDTGCDMDLFNANYPGKIEEMYNVLDPDAGMTDEYGHGTHIAGTIAEGTPSNVKILPVKTSSSNSLSTSDIITAINYVAAGKKADVINMSFGIGGPGLTEENPQYIAIEAAKQENIISVAAAGNEATDEPRYPSAFDNTISISAIGENDLLADFSSYGDMVNFAAPGVDILSINGTKSGTSMATPHAVSAVAIVKSINKDLSLEDTIGILKTRATDLGAEGWDHLYGNGIIDFSDAQICESASSIDCDEYGVFEKEVPDSISVQPILTPYNYGSLTNILASEITVTTTNGNTLVKQLGDLDDATITGYNPYGDGPQTVSVGYSGLTASFEVTNPSEYEMGWGYWESGGTIGIISYKDHGLGIKKLYFPEKIDGVDVVEVWQAFSGSTDAQYYEYVVLPETIVKLHGTFASWNSKMTNIEKIVSEADTVTITDSTFHGLSKLKTLDATIRLTEGSSAAFYLNKSLTSVKLSEDTTIIPAGAFNTCVSLESINMPEGITEIREFAFANAGIRDIVLPEALTKIGNNAFQQSKLESLALQKNVTEIGKDAFYLDSYLKTITVSPENTTFDSRNNSNSIIDTATNTLILGSSSTVVPDSVTTIGERAFFSLKGLAEISLPEGVITIEDSAFGLCASLSKIVLPESVAQIASGAFRGNERLVAWVHRDSYAHTYAIDEDIVYTLIEEPPINTVAGVEMSFPLLEAEGQPFRAFEILTPENTLIEVYYYDSEGELIEQPEIITDFAVDYGEYDSLRAGDFFLLTIKFDTNSGFYNFVLPIMLTVSKTTPTYTVPGDLVAVAGSRLGTIALPDGFSWMDESEVVPDGESAEFLAKYTPEDTDNYEIVENIPITIKIVELVPDDTVIKSSGNTLADILKELGNSVQLADAIALFDTNDNEVEYSDTAVAGTGYTLRLTFSDNTYDYKIAVIGDLTGDGIINSADLLRLRRHLLEIETLTGPYFAAADMEEDSIINSSDLLKMRQYLIGKGQ